MQEKTIECNENYRKYLLNAINSFRSGRYGTAIQNLGYARKISDERDWKKDFGMMFSADEDDFWSNLCIFNLCFSGTEACCEHGGVGCCGCCCATAGIGCLVNVCGGDGDMCGYYLIAKPIECCCGDFFGCC